MVKIFFLSVFLIYALSCSNRADKLNNSSDIKSVPARGYNLNYPDKTIYLPEVLIEISGITVIDSSSVACIQDEDGIIFIFDITGNELRDQFYFHSEGDYEGISRVDETMYVLRSDGELFEIENFNSSSSVRRSFSTGIRAMDIEGLCFDEDGGRLLIAPKSDIINSKEYDLKRVIYGFDLKSGILINKPVFEFDLPLIRRFALENNITGPVKGKKKSLMNESEINLRISDIAIHPITKKLFVLSASDKLLVVFNMEGTIESIERLNPALFNMPEGITFFKNGDLLISNEGRNKKSTLLRFNYH